MDYRSAVAEHEHETSSPVRETQHKLNPLDDLLEYVREYTREQPEVVALTCLGIGFILGWKLKPW